MAEGDVVVAQRVAVTVARRRAQETPEGLAARTVALNHRRVERAANLRRQRAVLPDLLGGAHLCGHARRSRGRRRRVQRAPDARVGDGHVQEGVPPLKLQEMNLNLQSLYKD